MRALNGMKQCSRCMVAKPKNWFNRNRAHADGRDPRCKQCVSVYVKSRGRRCEFCRGVSHRPGRFCSADCKQRREISLKARADRQTPVEGMLIAPQGRPLCPQCGAHATAGTDSMLGVSTLYCAKCGTFPMPRYGKVQYDQRPALETEITASVERAKAKLQEAHVRTRTWQRNFSVIGRALADKMSAA